MKLKFDVKKIFNKKVIIIVCMVIIAIISFGIFKMKTSTKGKTTENVKYTVLSKGNIETTISSSGTIESGESKKVYTSSTSTVETVNVEVGDQVKAGDVLAVLDTTSLENEINKLKESMEASKASNKIDLENKKKIYEDAQYLYDNNLNTEIINAEANVSSSKLDLEDKQRIYEYNKLLLDNEEISQQTLNQAQNDYENAKTSYDKATANLESTKVSVSQSLQKAKSDYENAQITYENKSSQLELESKEKDLEKCKIIAPIDGTITVCNATVGSSTNSSTALFEMHDLNNLIVNVSVDESDITKIKVGQKAQITTEATGLEVIDGEVVSIDPISSSSSSSSSSGSTGGSSSGSSSSSTDATFTVKVKINSTNENLKVGMNAVVNIVLDEKENVYSVPYESIVDNKGSFVYVANKENDKYIVKEIPVTTGIESDVNVEVEGAGLEDGLIILKSPSSYKTGDIVEIKGR